MLLCDAIACAKADAPFILHLPAHEYIEVERDEEMEVDCQVSIELTVQRKPPTLKLDSLILHSDEGPLESFQGRRVLLAGSILEEAGIAYLALSWRSKH